MFGLINMIRLVSVLLFSQKILDLGKEISLLMFVLNLANKKQ